MKQKRGWRGLLKNNFISLIIVLGLICLGGIFAGNVFITDGDINVDDDVNASGKVIAGNSYKAILGDDSNSKAGYFTDGFRTVDLGDGTYGVEAVYLYYTKGRLADSNYGVYGYKDSSGTSAGYFEDGTRSAKFADGSQAGYFSDGSNSVYLLDGSYGVYSSMSTKTAFYGYDGTYTAQLADGNEAGYFSDGTRTVELADGTYAIDVNSGSFTIDSSGNVYAAGSLTYDGGGDPPYLLWFNETRESVLELIRLNVPQERAGGLVQFYNSETDKIEYFKPLTCEYYSKDFVKIDEVDDGKPCYTTNYEVVYYFDAVNGEIKSRQRPLTTNYKIKDNYKLDQTDGKFYNENGVEVELEDAIVEV